MDTNIFLYHAFENRTMAFLGSVKPERWNQLLRLIDDMSRVAVSRVFGEGVFKYEFSWHTNNDILGSWIGCLGRDRVEK